MGQCRAFAPQGGKYLHPHLRGFRVNSIRLIASDAIPASLIEAAEQRYAALGPVGYEEAMIANVQVIGCQTPPQDAAEFLTTFDAGFRPAGLVFAAEHAAHQPQR
jgi:hypothetical protein